MSSGSCRLWKRAGSVLLSAVFAFAFSCAQDTRIPGYVYYRLNANPSTLDPALIVDVTGGLLAAKIFNGLVRLDDDLKIGPDLAESWQVGDGGMTYVFEIQRGVRFSNGREVTAEDFVYSFERVLSPAGRSPNTWVLDRVSGAREFMEGRARRVRGLEAEGRYRLRISLERPFTPFLSLLTMTAASVVPREEVERWGPDFSSHSVGTGPYLLQEWRHNSEIRLARNQEYFGAGPEVAGITYRIIPEDLTAVTEFEVGNLDVLSVPAAEYGRFRKSKEWSELLSSLEGLNTYYLGFNCSRPPFDEGELRRAVSQSIDREKILRAFLEGRGRLAAGPVPDLLRSWPAPEIPGYRPEAAKRLVEKRDLRGRVIHFYVTADQEVVDIAEIIQSYVNRTGLDVRIKQLEWSAYKAAINSGEADMFWLSWWADYPDPENFLFPLFHSANHGASGNRSRYTNSEVDGLIEAAQSAAAGPARNEHYRRAEEIIVAEAPWVFFWHRVDYTVRQPWIGNYRTYPIYSMDKGEEVSF